MVMISPGDLPAAQWLTTAQQCVRYHEDQGASPAIWADYAYDTQTPTLPEANPDGTPANTVMGAAYWLIHHLSDPEHAAHLSVSPTPDVSLRDYPAAPNSLDADLLVPISRQANGQLAAAQVLNMTLRNQSSWLDLCPVLSATIKDPGHRWVVAFRLDNRDITQEVMQGGFSFIKEQRLWPKASRHLQVVLTDKDSATAKPGALPPSYDTPAVVVSLVLSANGTRRDAKDQALTIFGSTSRPPANATQ